jgi:hypothetical protein
VDVALQWVGTQPEAVYFLKHVRIDLQNIRAGLSFHPLHGFYVNWEFPHFLAGCMCCIRRPKAIDLRRREAFRFSNPSKTFSTFRIVATQLTGRSGQTMEAGLLPPHAARHGNIPSHNSLFDFEEDLSSDDGGADGAGGDEGDDDDAERIDLDTMEAVFDRDTKQRLIAYAYEPKSKTTRGSWHTAKVP